MDRFGFGMSGSDVSIVPGEDAIQCVMNRPVFILEPNNRRVKRMNRIAILSGALTLCLWTQMNSANGLEVLVTSIPTSPAATNGFVQILPGQSLANQFSVFSSPGNPTVSIVDAVQMLFDPNATASQLANIHISLNSEVIPSGGGSPQPGPVLQVASPSQMFNMVNLTFSQVGSPVPVSIQGKNFLQVTYFSSPTSFQFPATPHTNYWLVVKNDNLSSNVGWAKSNAASPIYNPSSTASINPNTMNYANSTDGWVKSGLGNQIASFALINAPEPSTYILGTIAAGTLAFLARRPRRAKTNPK